MGSDILIPRYIIDREGMKSFTDRNSNRWDDREEARERVRAMIAMVDSLTDLERDALLKVYGDELRSVDAATDLGVNAKSIENALSRGIRKLRLRWDN